MAAQRLPMTMQEADMQVELQAVRRPETRLSVAMGQLGNWKNEGRDVRRLEGQMPSEMVQQGQTQAMQSPEMQQSILLMQQRHPGNEPQPVRRPSTQMPSSMVQQGQAQAVRSPGMQQSPPLMQQRNTGNEPQAMQSPSMQQPSMIPQRNTNESQAVNNAWNRQTVLNGYTPQAPAPPAKRRKMTYGISSPFVCR
jgi:hypothetical protein